MTTYRTFTAPVAGGELTAGEWRAEAPGTPVLAIHGVTASHRCWPAVVDQLPGLRVVAPDLRGRGRSNRLPPPYGLAAHADDMAALLDAAGIERAVVAGHSMGAFVAVRLAERHPDRVAGMVLVDGGLPIPPPEGVAPEDVAAAVLGPALERLSMTFADRAAYEDFWRRHPALGPYWSDLIADYVGYDLDGAEPALRSSASAAAVETDTREVGGADGYDAALAGLEGPVDFVRAPRGLLDQPDALYAPDLVRSWRERLPGFVVHEAEGVNHYTVVMGEQGARQVAPLIAARSE